MTVTRSRIGRSDSSSPSPTRLPTLVMRIFAWVIAIVSERLTGSLNKEKLGGLLGACVFPQSRHR